MKEKAIELINKAHSSDPKGEALVYSNQCFEWLAKINSNYTEEQEMAARCQHFKRWEIPRSDFPIGKKGYYQWRIGLYQYQADKAGEVLESVGYSVDFVSRVKSMISKRDLRNDANSQLIEDVACLVFLNYHIHPFASSKDFPFTDSVIIEVEAIEIAQPEPSNFKSSTFFLSFNFAIMFLL